MGGDAPAVAQESGAHRRHVPAHDAADAADEREAAARSFRVSLVAGGLAGVMLSLAPVHLRRSPHACMINDGLL